MKIEFKRNALLREAGFSLIELMVAMALSVVLLAGVIEIYINTKQTYNVQEGLSRTQENARFVIDRLTRELSSAGYLGCLGSIDLDEERVINTLTDTAALYNLETPVTGIEGAGTGQDEITIIRASGANAIAVTEQLDATLSGPITLDFNDSDYSDLDQYDVITISDCENVATFMITNVPGSDGVIQHVTGVVDPVTSQSNATTELTHPFGHNDKTPANVFTQRAIRYWIGTSAAGTDAGGACSATTPGYCALFENNAELVEGVEDLQIEYGMDTDGDADVDAYQDASGVGTNWEQVVSVSITVTVNEVERIPGSGNGITSADSSREYTSVVRLRSRGA